MKSEIARPTALLALQRATHATMQVLAGELVDLDLTPSEINALANLATDRGVRCPSSAPPSAAAPPP